MLGYAFAQAFTRVPQNPLTKRFVSSFVRKNGVGNNNVYTHRALGTVNKLTAPSYISTVKQHPCARRYVLNQFRFKSSAVRLKHQVKNKYKELVKMYGTVVIVFHSLVWVGVLGGIFVCLHHEEFDLHFIMEYLPAVS
mmetsp:Transcript_38104/g.61873  ORF Transcript_38104/g.61873 Transcript_38104/m.61873 type:complete len:138 (+) Transcript_38104:155-568(+)